MIRPERDLSLSGAATAFGRLSGQMLLPAFLTR